MSHAIAPPASVRLEAIDWMLRMKEEKSACFPELVEWLKRSPQHLQEYVTVSVVWEITGRGSFLDRFKVEQAAKRRSLQ